MIAVGSQRERPQRLDLDDLPVRPWRRGVE
jgi:hypothetical protein